MAQGHVACPACQASGPVPVQPGMGLCGSDHPDAAALGAGAVLGVDAHDERTGEGGALRHGVDHPHELPADVLRSLPVPPCRTLPHQVYFMVGFVTSARLLAFWALTFSTAFFSLTLFLACGSVMRKVPSANAIQVRRSSGDGRRRHALHSPALAAEPCPAVFNNPLHAPCSPASSCSSSAPAASSSTKRTSREVRAGWSLLGWAARVEQALRRRRLTLAHTYRSPLSSLPGWNAVYWANPLQYLLSSLSINELTSPDWAALVPGSSQTIGELALATR